MCVSVHDEGLRNKTDVFEFNISIIIYVKYIHHAHLKYIHHAHPIE